jgi:hypothetical protein
MELRVEIFLPAWGNYFNRENETFVTGTGFVLLGIESRNYSVDLYEKNPEFLFMDTWFLTKVFGKQCWKNGFVSLWRSSHEKSV